MFLGCTVAEAWHWGFGMWTWHSIQNSCHMICLHGKQLLYLLHKCSCLSLLAKFYFLFLFARKREKEHEGSSICLVWITLLEGQLRSAQKLARSQWALVGAPNSQLPSGSVEVRNSMGLTRFSDLDADISTARLKAHSFPNFMFYLYLSLCIYSVGEETLTVF